MDLELEKVEGPKGWANKETETVFALLEEYMSAKILCKDLAQQKNEGEPDWVAADRVRDWVEGQIKIHKAYTKIPEALQSFQDFSKVDWEVIVKWFRV
jgi:hypothetical protein